MLRSYLPEGMDIKPTDTLDLGKAIWVDVIDPSGDEINRVAQELNIPMDDIIDSLDPDERPRFEDEVDYFLLMLRVPLQPGDRFGVYLTAPVGFFVRKDRLVTVHTDKVDMKTLFDERKRKRKLKSSYEVLVGILGSVSRRLDKFIRGIQQRLYEYRHSILEESNTELVGEAHQLNNDLMFLSASVLGNHNSIGNMLRHKRTAFPKELMDRLEDIEIDAKQQHESASMYRELLENTLDAHRASISNNLNLVLKILASLSLILMLPTLIASLYGMNLDLPLQGNPMAFWIIVLVSVGWAGFLWLVFRKLDWL